MFRTDAHYVPTSRLQLLRGLPIFRDCTDEELARVDALVYETTVPGGTTLTVQGRVRRQAFIVLAGEASVEISGHVVGRITRGDLVGEFSLFDQRPQNATVTAAGPLQVLVMDPRELDTLVSDPRIAGWLAGDGPQSGDKPRPTNVPAVPGTAKSLRLPA
jgi:CRP/FNR family transcriptional regulator